MELSQQHLLDWENIFYDEGYQTAPENERRELREKYAMYLMENGVEIPKEFGMHFIKGGYDKTIKPHPEYFSQIEEKLEDGRSRGLTASEVADQFSTREKHIAKAMEYVKDRGVDGAIEALRTSPNASILVGGIYEYFNEKKLVQPSEYEKKIGYEFQPEGIMQNVLHVAPALAMDAPLFKTGRLAGQGLAMGRTGIVSALKSAPSVVSSAPRVAKFVDSAIVTGTEFGTYSGAGSFLRGDSPTEIAKNTAKGFVEGGIVGVSGNVLDRVLTKTVSKYRDKLSLIAPTKQMQRIEERMPKYQQIEDAMNVVGLEYSAAAKKVEMIDDLIKSRLAVATIPIQGGILTTAQAITNLDPSILADTNAWGTNIALGYALHGIHATTGKAADLVRGSRKNRFLDEAIDIRVGVAKSLEQIKKYSENLEKLKERKTEYDERISENAKQEFSQVVDGRQSAFVDFKINGGENVSRHSAIIDLLAKDKMLDLKIRNYSEKRAMSLGETKETLRDAEKSIVEYISKKRYGEFIDRVGGEKIQDSVRRNLRSFIEETQTFQTRGLETYNSDKGWEIKEYRDPKYGQIRFSAKDESGHKKTFKTREEAFDYAHKKQGMKEVLSLEEMNDYKDISLKLINDAAKNVAEQTFYEVFGDNPLSREQWKSLTGSDERMAKSGNIATGSRRVKDKGRVNEIIYDSEGNPILVKKSNIPLSDAAKEIISNSKVVQNVSAWKRTALKTKNQFRELRNAAGKAFGDMVENPVRHAANQQNIAYKNYETRIKNEISNYSKSEAKNVVKYLVTKYSITKKTIGEDGEVSEVSVRIGEKTLLAMKEEPVYELTAREAKLKDFISNEFADLIGKMNKARILAGHKPIPLPKNTEDYFPLLRRFSLAEQLGFTPSALDSKMADSWLDSSFGTSYYENRLVAYGHGKARVQSERPINLDLFETMSAYGFNTIRATHNIPVIAFLKDITTPIMTEKGPYSLKRENPYAYEIVKDLKDTISGLGLKDKHPHISKVLNAITENTVLATLGGYYNTIMSQIGAIDGTFVTCGTTNTLLGVEQAFNPKMRAWAKRVCPELETRIMDMFQNKYGKSLSANGPVINALVKGKQVRDFTGEKSLRPMEILDYNSALISFLSAHNFLTMDCGWEHGSKETIREATRMMLDVQGSGKTIDVAPMQRSALGKFIWVFQTFVINRFNWMMSDLYAPLVGKGNERVSRSEAVNNVLRYAVASSVVSMLYDKSEEKTGIRLKSPSPSVYTAVMKYHDAINDGKSFGQAIVASTIDMLSVVPGLAALDYGGRGMLGANVQLIMEIANYIGSRKGDIPDYQVQGAAYLMGKLIGVPMTQQVSWMINNFNANQKAMFEENYKLGMERRDKDPSRHAVRILREARIPLTNITKQIKKQYPDRSGRRGLDINQKEDYPEFGAGGYRNAESISDFIIRKK